MPEAEGLKARLKTMDPLETSVKTGAPIASRCLRKGGKDAGSPMAQTATGFGIWARGKPFLEVCNQGIASLARVRGGADHSHALRFKKLIQTGTRTLLIY